MQQLPENYQTWASQLPTLPEFPIPKEAGEWHSDIRHALERSEFNFAKGLVVRGLQRAFQQDKRSDASDLLELAADIEKAAGSRQRELEALIASIDIIEGRDKEDRIMELLGRLAAVCITLGKDRQSKIALDRAWGRWTYKNDWVQMSHACDKLGDAYRERGDLTLALTWYEQGLELRKAQPVFNPDLRQPNGDPWPLTPDRRRRGVAALSHQRIAQLYRQQGMLAEALQHLQSSVKAMDLAPEYFTFSRIEVLLLLAETQGLAGQSVAQEQTLGLAQRHADSHPTFAHAQSMVRRALGQLRLSQGRLEEARAVLREAAQLDQRHLKEMAPALVEELNIRPDRSQALLAQSYALSSDFAQAIALQREALQVCQGQDRCRVEPTLYRELADYHRRAGQQAEALAALGEARTRSRRMGSLLEQLTELRAIAEGYLQLGERQEALASMEEAQQLYESILRGITDPTQALAFPDFAAGPLYAQLARTQLLCGSSPADALVTLEQGRGQSLAFQVAQSAVDTTLLLSAEDRKSLKEAKLQMTEAGRLVRSSFVNASEHPLESAKKHFDEVAQRHKELETVLRGRYPLFQAVTAPPRMDKAQLFALAKKNPETLFLSFAVGAERTGVFLVSRAGIAHQELPLGEEALRKKLSTWRDALTAPTIKAGMEESRHASALYSQLLAPLEPALRQAKRLVIVPDGPLYDLPFSALKDSSGKRLIERLPLSLALSLNPLPQRTAREREKLVCIAAPRVDGEKRFALYRGQLGALPFALEEGRRLSQLIPGSEFFKGANAVEERVCKAMPSASLIHFATHALLDSHNGLRSWLLLASPAPGEADGRLEAGEVMGMRLKARLAVLSACNTARGQALSGEGLLGFAWAFQAAGCPRLLGTLWPIEDSLSPGFMESFYRGVQQGKAFDLALQSAILSALRQPETRRPQFWSAYTLTQQLG